MTNNYANFENKLSKNTYIYFLKKYVKTVLFIAKSGCSFIPT